MSVLVRISTFAAAFALSASAAFAQQASAAAPDAAASGGAAMPHDCKPRHDHMADKGMPMSKSAMCPDMPASAAKPKTKAVPRHDHGKFHKNQG